MRTAHAQITAAFTLNEADRLAVAAGCYVDPLAGGFAIWWMERHLRLYEGDQAGEPFILHGCHQCGPPDPPQPGERWTSDTQRRAIARAKRFAKCRAAGHRLDWQYDTTFSMFGWQTYSRFHRRHIRRFSRASIWTAKKNKKSPTLAAWGCYAFAGDGEPGAKVFLAAKDGGQAKHNAGRHVVEMISSSPELAAECTINRGEARVVHEPTRSVIMPLSSHDSNSQKAKEGLNANGLLVDETHVVDRAFMARVSRAIISRAEPIHAEFSTAGNEPESYGRERYEYAHAVQAGRIKDQSLLTAIYEAPQDIDEGDIAKDPLRYAAAANPALGHTVNPDELLHDFSTSRRAPHILAECLMYRFNIWQRSANPWLRAVDWDACGDDYDDNDLAGQPAILALDLSRTRDMTAAVALFDTGAQIRTLAKFWLPQTRADELRDKLPVDAWQAHGWLHVIPGPVVRYGQIELDLAAWFELFAFRELVYDPKFAEDVTSRLEETHGVDRHPFAQTRLNFAAPIDEVERQVVAGTLRHNKNPILTWQAGHVLVRNGLFVKPPKGDHKTIDGMVSLAMATARHLAEPIAQPTAEVDAW